MSKITIVNVGYRSTNYWVISAGRSRLLVDLGWPGTMGQMRANLKRMDVSLAEIRYGLATHYLIDHAGLGQELKQTGVPLLVIDVAEQITTLEAAERFISRGVTRFAEDGLPWVGIWLNGRMAGGILFFPLQKHIRATDVGYWLAEWASGRGLMTHSLRAVLGYVFDDLQLNRVGLKVEVDNRPSRAVAERLGFTLEGIERQGWVNDGQLVDMAVYSMLASEWENVQS